MLGRLEHLRITGAKKVGFLTQKIIWTSKNKL